MDELELLKKDWGKQEVAHKKLSSSDIYSILHKKSSSIVKTLFYISIGELIFWILINTIPYFLSEHYRELLESTYDNEHLFTILTVISYAVILLFIYLLFKSYRSISVTDNAKKLMESILKTRRVIKYYVIYNLVMAFILMVAGLFYAINHNPKLSETISHLNGKQLTFMYLMYIGFTAVFVFVIWLFYKLLYGLLLKRLNRNYKELKKLDI